MLKALRLIGLPLAIGLALAIRLRVAYDLNFDGLYGQDSFAYFYHGLALWHDHALEYHWPWLPAPTRLYWPLGYPALLALAFAVAGHASALAGQIVTLGCGGAVAALTYALAQRIARTILPPLASHAAAFCAAALIACSGLQVQASTTIMSDAPALCWAMLALWLWTGPNEGTMRRRATSVLAGASLAAAISKRYEYAPLIVVPAVYWWMTAFAGDAGGQSGRGVPSLGFGVIGALAAGLPQLVYSAAYSSPVLNNEWLTEWSVSHLWQASFRTPDGVQHYAHSAGAFYLLRPLVAPESLPWVLVPFLPLGLLALAWNSGWRFALQFRRSPNNVHGRAPGHDPSVPPATTPRVASSRPRLAGHASDLPAEGERARSSSGPYLALLSAWWLTPTLYLVGVPFESARFALIAQPALAIGEGIGLVWSARCLSARRPEYGRIIAASAVVWGACGLAIAAANSGAPVATLAQGKASDQAAVSWLRAHAPAGSAIATFDLTLTLYHYGDLKAHRFRLFDLSAIDAADWVALARAPHVLVVVNAGNLTRQWQALPPDQAFLRLTTERRLDPVATAGVYTIYE